MDIRKATEKDVATIRAIALPTWDETYSHILPKDQIEYMLEMMYSKENLIKQIKNEGHLFFIIFIDSEAAGFVSFEFEDEWTKLHKLYVLPKFQGRQLGKILIEEVKKHTEQRGLDKIHLNVNRYNSALSFYEKNGFSIIEEVDIEIGNGYLMEDYILEKAF